MKTYEAVPHFQKLIEIAMDGRGVYPHQGVILHGDNEILMLALDCRPDEALRSIVEQLNEVDSPRFACVAFDRSTRDDQGTTLGDVLPLMCWDAEDGWDFGGVIEYQHDPRVVKPLADNDFWREAIRRELDARGLR